jgi:hypothetical protein
MPPPSPARRQDPFKTVAVLVVIGVIGIVWLTSSSKDHSGQTISPVDFSKPLLVQEGMPACPTADDVTAMEQAAQAGRVYVPKTCGVIKHDTPIVVLENAGMAGPYRVRFLVTTQDAEAWVPYVALKN